MGDEDLSGARAWLDAGTVDDDEVADPFSHAVPETQPVKSLPLRRRTPLSSLPQVRVAKVLDKVLQRVRTLCALAFLVVFAFFAVFLLWAIMGDPVVVVIGPGSWLPSGRFELIAVTGALSLYAGAGWAGGTVGGRLSRPHGKQGNYTRQSYVWAAAGWAATIVGSIVAWWLLWWFATWAMPMLFSLQSVDFAGLLPNISFG